MRKGVGLIFLGVYVLSTVFFCNRATCDTNEQKFDAADFGVMCISSVYPGINFEHNKLSDEKNADSRDIVEKSENAQKDNINTLLSSDAAKNEVSAEKYEEKPEPVVFGDEPAVLIVHTHATESYLPSSEGNYHKKGSKNTVRDVGDVLAETLKQQGIASVHDKTLHDVPSYNQSYSRSYETTEAILKKYPSIRCVIDLHRDAIASESPAAVVNVNGKNCANYSYVVSNAVETYNSNLKFIKAMNEIADSKYKGFTGRVLERGYRYNQNLSSKYLLLEIGYNRNGISEARNTAEIFAKILAKTLKAGY